MDREAWVIPFKSQEFINGPELLQKRGTVTLRLDYEVEGGGGAYAWASVVFRETHAFRFTAWLSCTPEQIRAYDRLVEVTASDWVASLAPVPPGMKHYRVFFDELGCYEFMARRFAVDSN